VLLEVLGADVRTENIKERIVLDIQPIDIPAATQHVRYFPANVTVNADDVLWRGLAEVEGVEVPDPNQLPRGFLGVVLRGITGSRRRAARNGVRRSPSP
jgi:hypothetical protein